MEHKDFSPTEEKSLDEALATAASVFSDDAGDPPSDLVDGAMTRIRAEQAARRRVRFLRWGSLAACAVLALGLILPTALGRLGMSKDEVAQEMEDKVNSSYNATQDAAGFELDPAWWDAVLSVLDQQTAPGEAFEADASAENASSDGRDDLADTVSPSAGAVCFLPNQLALRREGADRVLIVTADGRSWRGRLVQEEDILVVTLGTAAVSETRFRLGGGLLHYLSGNKFWESEG